MDNNEADCVDEVRFFYQSLGLYCFFNALFVIIWLFFGDSWYFWPGISMFGWGVGLLTQALLMDLIPKRFFCSFIAWSWFRPETSKRAAAKIVLKKKDKPDQPKTVKKKTPKN